MYQIKSSKSFRNSKTIKNTKVVAVNKVDLKEKDPQLSSQTQVNASELKLLFETTILLTPL